MKTTKYCFEDDMGIEYQDSGRWRSYQLCFAGDNLQEILEDATIEEIDQDGGELNCYGVDDAEKEVKKRAYGIIESILRGSNENK